MVLNLIKTLSIPMDKHTKLESIPIMLFFFIFYGPIHVTYIYICALHNIYFSLCVHIHLYECIMHIYNTIVVHVPNMTTPTTF